MAKDDIPGERQRAFPRGRAKEQRLVQGLLSGRCGTRDMGGAGAVLTDFSIPAIAIARDPGIEFPRHETNSWKKQDPGQEFPAGKQHRDTSPSVRAAIDSAARVHRLHPTQGRVAVHLRETPLRFGVVGVEELDEAAAVEAAHARGAGPAQRASSVIENGELRHALFSVAGQESDEHFILLRRILPAPFQLFQAPYEVRGKSWETAQQNLRTGQAKAAPHNSLSARTECGAQVGSK